MKKLRNRFICEKCGAVVYVSKNGMPAIKICNQCRALSFVEKNPLKSPGIYVENPFEDERIIPIFERPSEIIKLGSDGKETKKKKSYSKT